MLTYLDNSQKETYLGISQTSMMELFCGNNQRLIAKAPS